MSLFKTAMLGMGVALAGKAAGSFYEEYVADTSVGGFLSGFNIGGKDVGAAVSGVASAVATGMTGSYGKFPDVDTVPVSSSGGDTAGTFAPGKTANIPMGTQNTTYNSLNKPGVKQSLISRVQTVGLPSPNVSRVSPNIKLGSSQVSRTSSRVRARS